jgi:biopolymer transport protein ExbD
MSEIAQDSGKKKHGTGKTKKMSTFVDFTPMVDLAFLLITFFMLATTLAKPQTMEIALPARDNLTDDEQTKVKASRAVTIILGKDDKVFYYEGTRENDVDPVVNTTNFSPTGVRKFLIQKNYSIMVKIRDLKQKLEDKQISQEDFDKQKDEIIADKSAPIVLIKGADDSKYRDFIDILDEMAICNIAKFAVVDITPYDLELIKNLNI